MPPILPFQQAFQKMMSIMLIFSSLLLSACQSKEITRNAPMVVSPPEIPQPMARVLPQDETTVSESTISETRSVSTVSSTFNNPNYQGNNTQTNTSQATVKNTAPKEPPAAIPKQTFFNTTSTSSSAAPVFTTIPAPKGFPMLPTASVKLPTKTETPPAKRVRLMLEENEAIKRESESIETELKSGELEEPDLP